MPVHGARSPPAENLWPEGNLNFEFFIKDKAPLSAAHCINSTKVLQ